MTHADRRTPLHELELKSLRESIGEAIKNVNDIDLAPLQSLPQDDLEVDTESFQQTIQADLRNLELTNSSLQRDFRELESARSTSDTDDTKENRLSKFLGGSKIDRDGLGEPPLADGEDPLLDRERLTLDTEDPAQ